MLTVSWWRLPSDRDVTSYSKWAESVGLLHVLRKSATGSSGKVEETVEGFSVWFQDNVPHAGVGAGHAPRRSSKGSTHSADPAFKTVLNAGY